MGTEKPALEGGAKAIANLGPFPTKIGKEEFARRLKVLLEDSFHAKNCNKIKYVYNNIKGFKEPTGKVVRIS